MGLFNLFKKTDNIKSRQKITPIKTNQYSPENNYIQDEINYKNLPAKTIPVADIVMLNSFKRSPKKISSNINDYPQYYVYQYNINPIKLSYRLLEEEYLSSSNTKQGYIAFISSLKIIDLKKLLDTKQIKAVGKKDTLIKLVIDNFTYLDIKILYPEINELYFITEKGLEYMQANLDLYKFHQKHSQYSISYEEYIEAKNALKFKASFNDIVWGILNSRGFTYENMRSNCLSKFHLLFEEKKLELALYNLLIVFYDDLSGMDNLYSINMYASNFYSKSEILKQDFRFTFAPGIIDNLIKLKDYYNENVIDSIYNTYKLPICCCPSTLFKEIVYSMFNNENFNKQYYIKILDKNMRKFIKEM